MAAADAKLAGAGLDDEDGRSRAPGKKKFSVKFILIAAAALLVVAGGGAGAYFFFSKKEVSVAAPVVKPPVFIDIPDVLVNLAGGSSERPQYLKVKIVLELADQAMVPHVQPFMPRVIDAFQTYLRELRATDLDGSAGLYRMREELTRRVNAAVSPHRINAVLFKEIVIQ
jgi:flagellar FliL protein